MKYLVARKKEKLIKITIFTNVKNFSYKFGKLLNLISLSLMLIKLDSFDAFLHKMNKSGKKASLCPMDRDINR